MLVRTLLQVILEEFVECKQPSEMEFRKLPIWVCILNLPFNLLNEKWGKVIAIQIGKVIQGKQMTKAKLGVNSS